ncbi:MAG: hypothetical protein FGM18_01325 [Burkholderiaceae bacterium]|nr:hypothetical protein [Burkholderiaceae bacterium]
MQTPDHQHDILEMLHVIHNQLEIITGSAHLVGLSPALSERDRQDLLHIQQAAHAIATVTQSIRQRTFSRDQ